MATGTASSGATKTKTPIETGLIVETTRQEGRQSNLVAEVDKVQRKERIGL